MMATIRRHLLVVALLLLAAQGTGFLVSGGRCTCGMTSARTECTCCKNGKMESGADCPMCKRARQGDATTCRCSARCAGHDAALPWLVQIDAVLPGDLLPSSMLALAGVPPAPDEAALDAVRRPPSPPPKAGLS